MPATKCSCHHRSWHGVTNNYRLGWAAVLTGMWVIASGIDIKFSIVWNKNAQVLQKDAQIWAVFTDVCWVESVPSSLTSCREQRTLHHEVLSKTQMSSEQVVHCQAISDHGNHLSSFRLLLLAACLLVVRKRRGYLKLTRLLFAFQSMPSGISERMLADHRQLPLNLFDAILIYFQCETLERAHTAVQFSETCTNSFWSGFGAQAQWGRGMKSQFWFLWCTSFRSPLHSLLQCSVSKTPGVWSWCGLKLLTLSVSLMSGQMRQKSVMGP